MLSKKLQKVLEHPNEFWPKELVEFLDSENLDIKLYHKRFTQVLRQLRKLTPQIKKRLRVQRQMVEKAKQVEKAKEKKRVNELKIKELQKKNKILERCEKEIRYEEPVQILSEKDKKVEGEEDVELKKEKKKRIIKPKDKKEKEEVQDNVEIKPIVKIAKMFRAKNDEKKTKCEVHKFEQVSDLMGGFQTGYYKCETCGFIITCKLQGADECRDCEYNSEIKHLN